MKPNTMPTTTFPRKNIQYALRRARPLNTAYCFHPSRYQSTEASFPLSSRLATATIMRGAETRCQPRTRRGARQRPTGLRRPEGAHDPPHCGSFAT